MLSVSTEYHEEQNRLANHQVLEKAILGALYMAQGFGIIRRRYFMCETYMEEHRVSISGGHIYVIVKVRYDQPRST